MEEVVVHSKYCPSTFLEGLRKSTKTPAPIPTETGTGTERCHYARQFAGLFFLVQWDETKFLSTLAANGFVAVASDET
jgi:hypothetical protein